MIGVRAGDPTAQVDDLGRRHIAVQSGLAALGIKIRAGPEYDPIGIRRGLETAKILIAESEGVGQSPLKWSLGPLVVSHGRWSLPQRPITELSLVPCALHVREVVRHAGYQGGIHGILVEMKGRNVSRAVRLPPH